MMVNKRKEQKKSFAKKDILNIVVYVITKIITLLKCYPFNSFHVETGAVLYHNATFSLPLLPSALYEKCSPCIGYLCKNNRQPLITGIKCSFLVLI